MRRYWSEEIHYSQPTAHELKNRVRQSVSDAEKKGKKMHPVYPPGGRKLCNTWWGQAWCDNLEKYADFSSRLERGRRYFHSGTVIDLIIKKGLVEAQVQGTKKRPYKIRIKISPLSQEKCEGLIESCGRRISNMESLVRGEFPEDLKDLFTSQAGLFPEPKEISFNCSCPDWALMCKHVSAVMYSIAVRVDENPFYFFELRGIDIERFIDVTLENKVEQMLKNADCESERIIDDADLTALFGVL